MTACANCKGSGRRFSRVMDSHYVCDICGGTGCADRLSIGWLDGLGNKPAGRAPTNGERLALVYLKDGRRDDLPGQLYWRLALVLCRVYVDRGRRIGGSKRVIKDAKGTARHVPLMGSGVAISGYIDMRWDPAMFPASLGAVIDNVAIEITGQFPRDCYRSSWRVGWTKQAAPRIAFESHSLVLEY